VFVDELPFKAKVPVNGPKSRAKNHIIQTGFFADLPQPSFFRTFGTLQVSFGKTPVAIRILDEEGVNPTIDPPEYNSPGAPFRLCPSARVKP
jgi:hypothetical protein